MRLIFQSLALLMLLGVSPSAFAQRLYEPELFPAYPSDRDARYVVFVDKCGDVEFEDPARLRPDGYGNWILELRQGPEILACFPTSPPFLSTIHAFRLPTSVLGRLTVDFVPLRSPVDSFRLFATQSAIPPSITGTWHDPTMPGQGIKLAYAEGGRIDVHWATFEATGTPLWLVGAGPVDVDAPNRHRRTAPLFALRGGNFPGTGTATPAATEWGSLSLEYLGCGRLQVSWEAVQGARYPAGTRQFEQFSGAATTLCDLNRLARSQSRRVRLYDVRTDASP